MTSTDAVFSGSIPALYQRCLEPLLFQPYADDLARRVAELRPQRILETAAGTGIVTQAMAEALPHAEIVATDLNQAMLDLAATRVRSANISFRQADAQALPFADAAFDAVVCQFGAMFFPDRVLAFREARRVLRPGGHLLFNVWNRLEENPVSNAAASAVANAFPGDPPSFFSRVPFGYYDKNTVERDVRAGGFRHVSIEIVGKRSPVASARDAAIGLCQGTPLRAEIEARDAGRLEGAT
ncbi:MAG TPA: class I SAM-dependent methyltransferase, partial [Microvirga sp.]|nr:class I SAM-dependent methyltransferase [Microvirga sp.]